MEDYKVYKKGVLMNSQIVDIIANGDLSVDNCIDELEKCGYRIIKKP